VTEWVAFEYREFYDYPRAIIVEVETGRYLLDCPFDDRLDNYPPDYQIIKLHGPPDLAASWDRLASQGEVLGSVPVSAELFDESRRRVLRWDVVRKSIRGSTLDG